MATIGTGCAVVVSGEIQQEFNHIDKDLIKKKKWLERRKELRSWYKRAEVSVGRKYYSGGCWGYGLWSDLGIGSPCKVYLGSTIRG